MCHQRVILMSKSDLQLQTSVPFCLEKIYRCTAAREGIKQDVHCCTKHLVAWGTLVYDSQTRAGSRGMTHGHLAGANLRMYTQDLSGQNSHNLRAGHPKWVPRREVCATPLHLSTDIPAVSRCPPHAASRNSLPVAARQEAQNSRSAPTARSRYLMQFATPSA